jgi:pilus assembly protein CpaB
MSAYSRRSATVSAARFGALGLGAVALGCAALAAFFVGKMLTAKGYTGERVRPVVVAAHDLSAAQPLSSTDLAVVDWPEGSVPAGAFETVEAVFDADARPVPSVGVLAGEPLVSSRLSSVATGTGIARLVRPNMRAVALKVDDSVGYTGLVYPGAYVDVIVTIRDPEGRGPSSRIGVQNARVLTVGADTDVATRRARERSTDKLTNTPDQGGTYVTLEVTPQEAEILSIARNEGKLDLALRNGTDEMEVETDGARPNEFSAFAAGFDSARPPALAKRADPEPEQKSRRSKKKRIQIVASDEADAPSTARKAPARIETHYAN